MSSIPCVVSAPEETIAPALPAPGSRLVLLIEDDDCVASVLERTLVRAGHRVLCARDGSEGAQLFGEYGDDIALVMIDCGLPDINGAALFSVLRRHQPSLPIVLMSGWANEGARLLADEGPAAFVPKPFSANQIETVVESLLWVAA